jgi:Arc/MetJ-type ribon-helix-helix transcriptional regulator
MFDEDMKLTNFRLPTSMLDELDDARHALAKQSVAHLVRDALREYLDRNQAVIEDVRKARERHGR